MPNPEIFIYYRIAVSDRPNVSQLVGRFQAALCQRFAGLQARLLARTEATDASATLMETYAFASGQVAPTGAAPDISQRTPDLSAKDSHRMLLAAIEQEARIIEPWLHGSTRHVEVFEPCA